MAEIWFPLQLTLTTWDVSPSLPIASAEWGHWILPPMRALRDLLQVYPQLMHNAIAIRMSRRNFFTALASTS